MGRAPCCDKANVKRGPWSPEEDNILKSYLEKHGNGGSWIALPHKAGLNRCGKSCRLRWLNYLRPDIKLGGFTGEEDDIICSLYNSIGSRWSVIASRLPGRTDNDVKNYWNTKLKKKLLKQKVSVNSTQDEVTPCSIPALGDFDYRNTPNYFNANSGTLPYESDITYQQNHVPEGIISDPSQVTFSGHMGDFDCRTSANNSCSTISSSQEAASLSISSSFPWESNFIPWSAYGNILEDEANLPDFSLLSPSEFLHGFDFQKANFQVASDIFR